MSMRIAVVGTGAAGIGAAWALSRHHEVVVYEAAPRPGGHVNTVDVDTPRGSVAVDTGFIVHNDRNYPNLTRFFDVIGIETQESDMSFSVSLDAGTFEYAGSPGGLLAQPSNLLRRRYWRMLADLRRFYAEAPSILDESAPSDVSIGEFLNSNGYSDAFIQDHLLPMSSAVWSAPCSEMLAFPARSFVTFCRNHGLLDFLGRPQWRTVTGGARRYVERVLEPLGPNLRLATGVRSIDRSDAHAVTVRDATGAQDRFDHVVMAVHGDEVLPILGDHASGEERSLFGAFRYSPNRAVLHSDPTLMPTRRSVWSSWNYLGHRSDAPDRAVGLTYWMNRLQRLPRDLSIFVTLNPARQPDPDRTHACFDYSHPVFDGPAIKAQDALPSLQGQDRVWFCGSYCGYGFHEDAFSAGLWVAEQLGAPAPWIEDAPNSSSDLTVGLANAA